MPRFFRYVSILSVSLGLGACSTVDAIMPDFGDDGETEVISDATDANDTASTSEDAGDDSADADVSATDNSDAAPDNAAAADGTAGALNISEPAPAEANPASAAQLGNSGWQSRVSPDIPYFNLGSSPVATYADSDLNERTGALARGEGGFVQTCREDAAVCRISPGNGGDVWVEITQLSGVAN